MNSKKIRYRFTLIELLVVIAIIGILASMLLPALNQARSAGKSALCVNNLKQYYLIYQNYCNDYDGWLPPTECPSGNGKFTRFDFYEPYCGITIAKVQAGDFDTTLTVIKCPSDPDYIEAWGHPYLSYCVNSKLGNAETSFEKIHSFGKPSECMMISESDSEIIKAHPVYTQYLDYNHARKNNVSYLDGRASHQTFMKWQEMIADSTDPFWTGGK